MRQTIGLAFAPDGSLRGTFPVRFHDDPPAPTPTPADLEALVDAAISGIVGQTAREIATRAGVAVAVAQKTIRKYDRAGLLERVGNRYRYPNAAPWTWARSPLPPLTEKHSVELAPSLRVGFRVRKGDPR